MKRVKLICLLLCSLGTSAFGQSKPILLPYYIENGDTIPIYTLRDAIVSWNLDDDTRKRQKYWARLKRDVATVMPYAKICSIRMEDLNRQMDAMGSKRDKNKYLKAEEKKLKEEFEAKLKNLDVDQGKILIKLIDRETGHSSYSLIKEYKSGFSAFLWNGMAKICGMSLKDRYDPVDKDSHIEWVVKSLGYN